MERFDVVLPADSVMYGSGTRTSIFAVGDFFGVPCTL